MSHRFGLPERKIGETEGVNRPARRLCTQRTLWTCYGKCSREGGRTAQLVGRPLPGGRARFASGTGPRCCAISGGNHPPSFPRDGPNVEPAATPPGLKARAQIIKPSELQTKATPSRKQASRQCARTQGRGGVWGFGNRIIAGGGLGGYWRGGEEVVTPPPLWGGWGGRSNIVVGAPAKDARPSPPSGGGEMLGDRPLSASPQASSSNLSVGRV